MFSLAALQLKQYREVRLQGIQNYMLARIRKLMPMLSYQLPEAMN
jgi:hypothetical protein